MASQLVIDYWKAELHRELSHILREALPFVEQAAGLPPHWLATPPQPPSDGEPNGDQ